MTAVVRTTTPAAEEARQGGPFTVFLRFKDGTDVPVAFVRRLLSDPTTFLASWGVNSHGTVPEDREILVVDELHPTVVRYGLGAPAPAVPEERLELVEWLREQAWSGFAQSVVEAFDQTGQLSAAQWASADRMRGKCLAHDAARTEEQNEHAARMSRIAEFGSVADGRYAVEREGVLRFYRVSTPAEGRWAGRTFVEAQASDDLHPVRGAAATAVLGLIAVDPQAAMLRYGVEIGRCGHCNRTLTDPESRARGIGPVCASKIGF